MLHFFAALAAAEPLCDALTREGWVAAPGGYAYSAAELDADFAPRPGAAAGMAALLAALRASGTTVVVVLLPTRPMANPDFQSAAYDRDAAIASYRANVAWLRAQGVLVVDTLDQATATHADTEAFFLRGGAHWGTRGARITAEATARALAETGVSATLRPVPHLLDNHGSRAWSAEVQRRCPSSPSVDSLDRVSARPASPPGLLDDVPPPDVVLVGTSFSEPAYHFADYLRVALATEVTVYANSGGRALGALSTFLHSDERAAQVPRVLVWELNVAHLFGPGRRDAPSGGDLAYYRQVVPAALGDCASAPAASSTSEAGPLPRVLYAPSEPRPAQGQYLALRAAQPVTGFALDLVFGERTERFTFPDHARVDRSGRYFLDLRARGLDPLRTVTLAGASADPGTVTMHLCNTTILGSEVNR